MLLTTTGHRISEAETQIGAGLIEEVIEVAEGELSLVKIMAEHKVLVFSRFGSEVGIRHADFP